MDNKKPPTIKIIKKPVNTIKYVEPTDPPAQDADPNHILTSTADHKNDTVMQPAFSEDNSSADHQRQGSMTASVKSMSQTLKKAKSVNIKDLIKHDAEAYRQQVQYYSDIFQSITGSNWTPTGLISQIHILVKSLGLDAVSIMMIDTQDAGKLTEPVSRGFKNPPGVELSSLLSVAVNAGHRSIDWRILMDIVADESNLMGVWVKAEGICMTGFVPITDNHSILGFLMVSSYSENEPSPLASPILELCGSGLGITSCRESDNGIPAKIMDSSASIQHDFTELINYIENLKGAGTQLTEEEINALAEKSRMLMDCTLASIRQIKENTIG